MRADTGRSRDHGAPGARGGLRQDGQRMALSLPGLQLSRYPAECRLIIISATTKRLRNARTIIMSSYEPPVSPVFYILCHFTGRRLLSKTHKKSLLWKAISNSHKVLDRPRKSSHPFRPFLTFR